MSQRGARLSLKNKCNDPKEHWLDHATPQYGTKLVNDIKIVLNTIVMYLPVPMFWALNDQTGSRWTLQATRLDGDLGFYVIKPDQMQFVLPVMVMLSIALLDCGMNSVLHRVGINSDLRRMVFGATLTALSFIAAGALELVVMQTSNRIHMLWMIPQYCLISFGEAIFGVTGARFAYIEAPESMKTVVLSCWLLTMSAGNLIALIVVSLHIFETEVILKCL